MNGLSVIHTTHLALSETRSRPDSVGTYEGQGGSNAKVRSTLIYDADLRELPYQDTKKRWKKLNCFLEEITVIVWMIAALYFVESEHSNSYLEP